MKTIAIIPARGNSKRLPGKNIKSLGELPLIAHSINYAKNHDFIDDIYITTNDQEIKKIAGEYNVKIIDRPEVLSGDFEPTVSALKHVIETIEEAVETIILLQPTNPLRPKHLLKNVYKEFRSKNKDSAFTVSQNYQKFGKIEDSRFKPFNYKIGQRSQDLEPLYFENGLIYITKAKCILKEEIITANALPFIVDHPFATIDIDTQEEFDLAEFMLKKYKNE